MGQKINRTILADSIESLSNRKCYLSPSLLQGIELINSLTEMEGFAAVKILCSHIKNSIKWAIYSAYHSGCILTYGPIISLVTKDWTHLEEDLMTSEQPTHSKMNPQLFLFTRDGRGSIKPCLPFLLVQIQCDGFLWRPQRLACPRWSKEQDSCVSHRQHRDRADCLQRMWAGVLEKSLCEGWACG